MITPMRITMITAMASLWTLRSEAQVILEVLQGATWTASLTLSQPQTMNFRWKWSAPNPIASAMWQVTFSSPTSSTVPIAVSGALPVPAQQSYAQFSLPVPAGATSTFHVRVRTAAGLSGWIPVFIGTRAQQTSAVTRAVPPPPPSGIETLKSGYLPDLTCVLQARRPVTADDPPKAWFDFVPILDGQTHQVPGSPLPPDITYALWLKNSGGSLASAPLLITTSIDGTPDLNEVRYLATSVGGANAPYYFKTSNVTGWEDGRVTITVRATADKAGTIKEQNESNNQCKITFSLYTKTPP